MSNLSELLPAGAGAKSAEFVASGTLGSGVTVALKADGTVTAIAETTISDAIGTQANAANVNSEDTAVIFDSATDKFTLFYADRNNSDYGTYVVGTISGTSITFGTPAVFNSAAVTNVDSVYDEASGNIVVVWAQAGTGGRSIVGSRSGDTITFGSAVTFDSNSTFAMGAAYIEDAAKVFISYQRNVANTGHGIVGTVSGTSISFGSATTMPNTVNPRRPSTTYVGSSKAVVATRDNSVSPTAGKAVVATISGTSVSFGSFTTFETQGYVGTGFQVSPTYDSVNDKVVIGWTDGGNSDYGTAIVGEVSGTSITFGTAVVFASTNIRYYYSPTLKYSIKSGNIFIIFIDGSDTNKGKYVRGTVTSGLGITFGSITTFTTDSIAWLSLDVNNTNNKFVVGYKDDTAGGDPSAQIIQDAYLSSNNTSFIGITDQAIANTATGAVIVQGGVSEKLSGLTVGADYYVQADGVIAASGSVPFSISGATFTQNFSVSAQDSSPRGIAFNTDGTKMFITGSAGVDINEYALTTGFDISTASYSQNFSVISQTTSPRGVAFNTDGTKMFVVGQVGSTIYEYNLATGFNISTASYSQNFSLSSQETGAQDVAFNTDGTKMFIVGTSGQDVNEYTLSTGFDVSSASYSQNFSVSSQDTIPTGITFNTDGTSMFITGQTNDKVFEYTLTSGFDVSTASYSSTSFSVLSEESNPLGLVFNSNGTKMFITGTTGDDVNEYSTTAASTTVPAGRALSSTSILLEG